jgi:hypothetical protein
MHKSSRFALPLITRPTEHSGVTFGAATSVLLTAVAVIYLQEHYKKGETEGVKTEAVLTYRTWWGTGGPCLAGNGDPRDYSTFIFTHVHFSCIEEY